MVSLQVRFTPDEWVKESIHQLVASQGSHIRLPSIVRYSAAIRP